MLNTNLSNFLYVFDGEHPMDLQKLFETALWEPQI